MRRNSPSIVPRSPGNNEAINVQKEFLRQMVEKKGSTLVAEFNALNREKKAAEQQIKASRAVTPWEIFKRESLKPAEIKTNRYENVPCLDVSRIIVDGSKYIHGNYVKNHDGKKVLFLATQGPLESTQAVFWAMVVQEKSGVIIMLCQCKEKKYDEDEGRTVMAPKCAQYWPKKVNNPMIFGKYQITATAITTIPYHLGQKREQIIKTQIEIVDKDTKEKVHDVLHVQYTDWEDLNIPRYTEPVMDLMLKFVLPCLKEDKPATVHCSAGVGRTGVFIGAMYCLDLFLQNQLVTIPHALKALREYRYNSVQTPPQYIYMHILLLELIEYCGGPKMDAVKEKFFKAIQKLKTLPNPRRK